MFSLSQRILLPLLALLCACMLSSALPEALPGETQETLFAQTREALPAETEVPEQTVYESLSPGSRGDAVLRLQERLAELGYDPGEADGIYGTATRKAVKAFQQQAGLEADGYAGPLTQAALYADSAPRAPEPEPPVDVLASPLPLLVNREHPVDESFVPADLVDLSEICDASLVRIKYAGTRAVRPAAEALERMLQAAAEDGIVRWQVSAAYRSYEDQEKLMNAKINSYLKKNPSWSRARARSAARRTVADPGASEHHTGLAVDINVPGASAFLGTRQCSWLHAHCWEYGFILRYPAGKEKITGFTAEAWHIRYVGTEHSLIMRDRSWCLEEYLEAVDRGEIDPPAAETEEDVDL